jgi:hypothetical protein
VLTRQTRDFDYETEITIKKQITINYEVQYPINQVLEALLLNPARPGGSTRDPVARPVRV